MVQVFRLTPDNDTFPEPGQVLDDDLIVEALPGEDSVQGGDFNDAIFGNEDGDLLLGRFGSDTIYGGQGNDAIDGDDDNDLLLGNLGEDTIEGGLGEDIIYGGKEADLISGQGDSDLILGNLGNDTMTGGDANDTVYGGKGDDSLLGQAGFDLVLGNIGNDYIETGDGDDTAYGGQEADTIFGGAGDDLLLGNLGTDEIDGGAGDDTAYGGKEADTISGGDGNDLLLGNLGTDEIDGGAGDDTIYGGQGSDTVSGGAGVDVIFAGLEDDSIIVRAEGDLESDESIDGGDGEDTLFVEANSSLEGVTLTSVENLVLSEAITVTSSLEQAQTFDSISSLESSVGILQITATEQEILDSGILGDKIDGSVTVLDQDGNVIQVGMPEGEILGTENADTITPEEVSEGVTGGMPGDGDDAISGMAGNDTIDGGGGNDTINGGDDADEITGGAGVDAVSAGTGDDVIILNEGDAVEGEVIDGEDGTDTLSVQGNSSLETVTIASVENLVLADGVTVISSLDQAQGFASIDAEDGATGTLQINATAEDIIASGVFSSISDTITVLDGNGEVVPPPVTDIIGTEEADSISGAEDADFQSTNGPDNIDALGGNDTVFGEGGNDTIVAGTGDDQAWGGTGTDSIQGGAGNDTLGIEAGDTAEGEVYDGGEGEEEVDTILATGGGEIDLSATTVVSVEELNVGEGTTVIVSLDNIEDGGITTFSANIEAEDGVATIKILGTTAQVEAVLAGITIEGGTDSGIVVLNQDGEQVFPAPMGGDIDGTDGNDTLVGTDASERIRGFAGDDILEGVAGDDTLEGGADNDTLTGGVGNDDSFGDTGDDNFRVNAGDVEEGELYDGGDDRDTMSVLGDNNLSIATLESIEVLDVAQAVTAIVSQANLDQGGSVEALTGSGTIQAAPNPDDPDEVVELDLTGIEVSNLLTIEDSAGNVIQAPETDNPDDPDKLRPIVYTLQVGPDVTSFDGRADAPLENTNIGTVPTLENGDNLEGTGENDVITAILSTNSDAPVSPVIQPILRGIETVNISPFEVANQNPPILRASQITGTNDFVSSDGNDILTIEDIPTIPENLILRNAFAGMNVTVRNSAISGSTDIANVTLENVQASGEIFNIEAVSGNNGFETVNIDSSTPDSNADLNNIIDRFTFGNDNTTTVNITGTQDLELEANSLVPSFPNEVTTINAGNTELGVLEGDLIIGLAPDSNLTFTGGNGNDDISFGVVNTVPFPPFVNPNSLDGNDIIDGGAGEENIVRAVYNAALPATADNLQLSNIQNFYVDLFAVDLQINMEGVEGLNKIRLENGNNARNILTIANLDSAPTEIEYRGNGTTQIQNLDDLRLQSSSVSGGSDVITLDFENRDVNLGDNFYYNLDGSTITLDGYETINFNVVDGNLNFTIVGGQATPAGVVGNLTSSTLQEITFTGDNIQLNQIGTTIPAADPTISEFDASGVTGRFDALDVRGLDAGATITLSQNGGIFNAAMSDPDQTGNNVGVTINGGAGNDTITGSMDDDVIFGNEGDDSIDLLAAGGADQVNLNQIPTTDNIDNFTSGDDLIGLSGSQYGALSAGQPDYNVINAAAYVAATDNIVGTILEGTTVQLQNLGTTASNVKFVFAHDTSTLYYSQTGNLTNLIALPDIAVLNGVAGAGAVATGDFTPIA